MGAACRAVRRVRRSEVAYPIPDAHDGQLGPRAARERSRAGCRFEHRWTLQPIDQVLNRLTRGHFKRLALGDGAAMLVWRKDETFFDVVVSNNGLPQHRHGPDPVARRAAPRLRTPGNAARTRTRTACCGSTCQRASTSQISRRPSSTPLRDN